MVLVLLPTLLTKLEWLVKRTSRKLAFYDETAPKEVTA
jgi:hypothetical protein